MQPALRMTMLTSMHQRVLNRGPCIEVAAGVQHDLAVRIKQQVLLRCGVWQATTQTLLLLQVHRLLVRRAAELLILLRAQERRPAQRRNLVSVFMLRYSSASALNSSATLVTLC